MLNKSQSRMLLTATIVSSIAFSAALAQATQPAEKSGEKAAAVSSLETPPNPLAGAAIATPATTSSRNRNAVLRHNWGVDSLEVRSTSSGELLRFTYRVLDAEKAKVLTDAKSEPHLIDEISGYMLQVPTLEKVGQLRQVPTPENGRQYWMVFSNKGRLVKPGSRVGIVIGSFHADGLIVDGVRPNQ